MADLPGLRAEVVTRLNNETAAGQVADCRFHGDVERVSNIIDSARAARDAGESIEYIGRLHPRMARVAREYPADAPPGFGGETQQAQWWNSEDIAATPTGWTSRATVPGTALTFAPFAGPSFITRAVDAKTGRAWFRSTGGTSAWCATGTFPGGASAQPNTYSVVGRFSAGTVGAGDNPFCDSDDSGNRSMIYEATAGNVYTAFAGAVLQTTQAAADDVPFAAVARFQGATSRVLVVVRSSGTVVSITGDAGAQALNGLRLFASALTAPGVSLPSMDCGEFVLWPGTALTDAEMLGEAHRLQNLWQLRP